MAGNSGNAGKLAISGSVGIVGIAGSEGIVGITGKAGIVGGACGPFGAAARINPHPARIPVNPTKRVKCIGRIGAPPFLGL
jgi:hypothetical protein